MAELIIYNDNKRVAKTDKAFGLIITKELMRGWSLSSNLVNSDNAKQFAIYENAVLEVEGQKYDITGFSQNNGTTNLTSITANHVSYQANNYFLPIGYSFVGTIHNILADMINVAVDVYGTKANNVFSVGTTESVSYSISLGNTQAITLRAALWALASQGIEIDYDNFIINSYSQIGSDTGKIFTFGRDLCNLERKFNKTTNPPSYSYTVDIANLQRITGTTEFVLGDIVGIQSDKDKADVITQRIVTYVKCIDDATQDQVTIGTWTPDFSDVSSSMQVSIGNSVKQNEKYSNVSISHKDGFVASNLAGTVIVKMNADDGFAIYDNNGTFLGGVDVHGNLVSSKLTTKGSEAYGTVGNLSDGGFGLELFNLTQRFCYIAALTSGAFRLSNGNGTGMIDISANGEIDFNSNVGINFYKNNAHIGITNEIIVPPYHYHFTNGILTDVTT